MSLSKKLSITDLDLQEKRVLIRVDFNVPLQDGKITNPAVILLSSRQFIHNRLVAYRRRFAYHSICTRTWLVSYDHISCYTTEPRQVHRLSF